VTRGAYVAHEREAGLGRAAPRSGRRLAASGAEPIARYAGTAAAPDGLAGGAVSWPGDGGTERLVTSTYADVTFR